MRRPISNFGELRLRIRCSVCNKPVERIGTETDFEMEGMRILVFCHGARDAMTLTRAEIAQYGAEQFAGQEGVAFAPKIVVSGGADYQTEQQLIRGN